MSHPVTEYAISVIEGEIKTGKYVKWTCQRHLNDLKRKDVYFDEQAANRIINFYQLTPHVKGEWAGRPIELEPWQMFIVGCLFGWKKTKNDLRKYREAYIQVARKNGKSTMIAPIGLYGMKYDGEPGAEVYSAATTRDQAKEIFSPAKKMAQDSKYIKDISVYKNNLSHLESFSKFEPLSSDYDTLDGKNIHIGLVDELHGHPDSGIWDVLADGTGSRRQPLMIAITTAGYNTESFCFKMREDCIKVLNPDFEDFKDDMLFAYIAELDEEDNWENDENWVKANPNLGVSLKIENLKSRINKAKRMPTQRNRIICKRLNIWANAEVNWMDMKYWRKSAGYGIDELEEIKKELINEKCYAGLDLSNRFDMTAYIKIFPIEDYYIIIPEFFMPKDNITKRVLQDGVPYDVWAEKGFINATDGETVDYSFIEDLLLTDYLERYQILQTGHDRWGAMQLAQNLEKEEMVMVPLGQGYKTMSEPMKELEKLIVEKRIFHFNHPVLQWMASNVVATSDPADNIKPNKKKSKEKIDGIVATIMALYLCILNEGEKNRNPYEDPDYEAKVL